MRGSQAAIAATAPLLAELGFKKRAGAIFTTELAPGVLGWIGLNQATQHRAPGEVEINPVVGVRHQEIERRVADLRGEKFHEYQPPTVSTPLGQLLPQAGYRAWVFTAETAGDSAREMSEAISSFALPFMRSLTDLGHLTQALNGRLGFEHQLAYRRPLAWLLADDPPRARQALEDGLARLGAGQGLAAAEFRRFADELRRRLPP